MNLRCGKILVVRVVRAGNLAKVENTFDSIDDGEMGAAWIIHLDHLVENDNLM